MSAPHPDFVATIKSQREAADPNASAWVEANAGSGKTRVLIDRVTRLLLAGADPGRILCITYTKAAAAEMSERLFARLGDWSLLDDEKLTKELQEIEGLGREYAPEALRAARRLFARALETPGGLKIQTIHAFCEGVLRRFPLEAGVPANFQTAEEVDAKAMLGEAFGAAVAAPDLAPALERLALRYSDQDLRDLFEKVAAKRAVFERGLEARGLAGLVGEVAEKLGVSSEETEDGVYRGFMRPGLRARYRQAAEALRSGSANDKTAAQKIETAMEATDDRAVFAALRPLFITKKDGPVKRLATAGVAKASPDAAAFLETEQGVYLGADERLRSIAAYGDSAALMRFAASGLARYAQLKTASGRLDFDDMIEAVRRLLGSGAGAAWVLYKLDGGLSHILVDEAQDTSPDQWAVILKPLDEFFAGAGARAEREKGPRTVFAVGDEKQSIYSFQGADVAQFSATQDELARRVTAAGLQFHPKELLLSFRSAPPVLSAVDAMFADEARARCITTGASYTGGGPIVQHKAHRLGAAGLVELWPALEPAERSQSRVWDAPLDQEGEASPRRALAARIARTIAGWLASGEELVSKGRPIAPGDVMILVRRRNVFFEQMIRELKLHDVPVAGADRLKLTEDIAVMDLLSLARFSLAPGDDLSLAEALKSPLFGFDDDGLFKLAYGRKGSLWRAVQDRRGDHAEAAAVLAACVAHAGRAGPFAFFSDVLRTAQNGVSGRRRIYERLGLPAREALDELLNIALQYEAAHPPTLQGFVDWMERRETVLKRDHDREGGAVQVMTVHGAKGLEAEIVFLPDTCQTPQAGRWPFFQLASGALVASQTGERPAAVVKDLKAEKNDQQMEEYLRLLYVAATRARDRLYICGYKHMNSAGRPTIGKDSWYAIAEETLPPLMEEATGPDGETVWRLSSPQTAEIETKDGPVRAEVPPPPDWLFRPAPPARAPAARLAPSRAGKSAKPCAVLSPLAAMAPGLSPLARGRLIHKLLEVLPETAPDERRARALAFLARPSAAPAETRAAELEALADETLAVLADPAFAPVFAPGSRAEVPIIGASPSGAEVFGQVDRLTVEADRVLIADFKTDRPPPTSAEDADPAYVAQMALYRHVLAGVYPGREVACALVFTLGPRLISLPSAVLDGALSRL